MKRPSRPPQAPRRAPRTARIQHALIDALHRWVARQQLTLAELTPEHVRQFVTQPRGVRVSRGTRGKYRSGLRDYLQGLHARGLINFAPPPPRRPAPEPPPLAREFLASLAPTLGRRTCEKYIYAVRKLHGWFDPRGVELDHLTRTAIMPWLQGLYAAGLKPVSRRHILICARVYLHWLSERRRMRTAPDELIRRTDLPKLPEYLPRPLTADADRELQHRLGRSQAPGAWGLLLMRRTGLRLGELRSLEYHCIRTDGDCPLLKVPLGKLHNERLVPLDAKSVELIQRLQSIAPLSRAWLVPGRGGGRMGLDQFSRILEEQGEGLPDPVRITSHRLRHTYATEMLSAGMSLVAVMRLLGHRDFRMTLRYAAITPETVSNEYTKALAQLATKYRLPAPPPPTQSALDPDELLNRLSRWLRKHGSSRRPLRPLLKRIERLRHDVRTFGSSTKSRR